jgi:hypothetical protein
MRKLIIILSLILSTPFLSSCTVDNQDTNDQTVDTQTTQHIVPPQNENLDQEKSDQENPNQATAQTLTKLQTVTIAEPESTTLTRKNDYKVWNQSGNKTCWSVRDSVLKAREISKNSTDDGCKFLSGTWTDEYTLKPLIATTAKEVEYFQIDHIVPLHYASEHGANSWTFQMRNEFANNPNNLAIANGSDNQSKSDKGPSEWMPPNSDVWCKYATDWVNITSSYNISITKNDFDKLNQTLINCQ